MDADNPYAKYATQGVASDANDNPYAKYAVSDNNPYLRFAKDTTIKDDSKLPIPDAYRGDAWDQAKPGETVSLGFASGNTGEHYEATKIDDSHASKVYRVTNLALQHTKEDISDEWMKPKAPHGAIATLLSAAAGDIPSSGSGAIAMGAAQPLSQSLSAIPRVGPILGGAVTLGAGAIGSIVGREAVPPSVQEQLSADAQAHPAMAMLGGVAANAPFFGVGGVARDAAGNIQIGKEALARAVPATIGGGMQTGAELMSPDENGNLRQGALGRIALAAGQNAIFNTPTKLGATLMGGGPSIASRIDDASTKQTMEQANQAANQVAVGDLSQLKPSTEATKEPDRPLAPAEFAGTQKWGEGLPDTDLWNLTKDMGTHPKGSTVSASDIEKAGFSVPEKPEQDTNAVPEQGASEVPVVNAPGDGSQVGKNDRLIQAIARAQEAVPNPVKPAPYPEVSEDVRATPEYRQGVADEIDKIMNRSQSAKGVDVNMKASMAKDLFDQTGMDVNQHDLSDMSNSDLSTDAMERLRDRMRMNEYLGRLQVRDRRVMLEAEKAINVQDMNNSPSLPLQSPNADVAHGVRVNPAVEVGNQIGSGFSKAVTSAANAGRSLLQRDYVSLNQDGNQRGFLSRNLGGDIDLAYQNDMSLRDQWKAPLRDIVEKYKLDKVNADRIGMFMTDRQGLADRLGPKDAAAAPDIKLTEGEKAWVDAWDKFASEQALPRVKDTMRNDYNVDVEGIKNYWPLQRDPDQHYGRIDTPDAQVDPGQTAYMSDLAKGLATDFRPELTGKTDQGFTKERIENAKNRVRTDAFSIADSHIDAVSHLITHQHMLKVYGPIVNSKPFAAKYGDIGQRYWQKVLDTVARDGAPAGSTRSKFLDYIRNNTSSAILGWRLLSQVKHAPNLLIGSTLVGPEYMSRGLWEAAGNEGRDFVRNNFREIAQRSGGEPSIAELANKSSKLYHVGTALTGAAIGWTTGDTPEERWRNAMIGAGLGLAGSTGLGTRFQPLSQKNSFMFERALDSYIAHATVIGSYMKHLEEQGIDPITYKDIPINKEAWGQALVDSRRVVTSPLLKDLPQAISRGDLTGKNISYAKTLFQFQNTMLNQAGFIKQYMYEMGIKNKDVSQFTKATLGFLLMLGAETGIVMANKGLLGAKEKKDEAHSFSEEMALEAMKRAPFIGNIESAIKYGQSGVPTADAMITGGKALGQLINDKNDMGRKLSPKESKKNVVDVASTTLGGLIGVPGTSTAAQIIKNKTK